MATKAIVGEKVGMTQVWSDDNRVVPVTMVKVAPLRVVQIKTTERDGYSAVQVTFGRANPRRLNKPEAGHFDKAGVEAGSRVLELRIDDVSGFEVGQELKVDVLENGERVDVTAVSKGKGTAGVMKRHGFKGLSSSHGTQRKHRSPGSIGACATPGRVFKGVRMAGRMGGMRTTVQSLTVHAVDAERGLLLIKGAVPGPSGRVVLVRSAARTLGTEGEVA